MKHLRLIIYGIILGCLNFSPAAAAGPEFFNLGDFRLENGMIIRDCRIGYCTFGKLNAQKSNAILYPTWFGGISQDIAKLMGADKLVDTTRFFIIAVDALGNGVSSSPSNSPAQSEESFPQFNIRDMVRTQYRLATEKFGIKQLNAIIGGSLGSFQGFEWIVNYPDFACKAILYVASPQLTSYDFLEIRTQIEIIKTGWRNHQPEAEIARTLDLLTALMARTPAYRVRQTDRAAFPAYWNSVVSNSGRSQAIADRYSQLNAMLNHDIAAPFGGSLAKAAKKIKARTLIIVNRQDQIVNCRPALDFAPLISAEILILDSDCGHLVVSCEMDTVRQRIAVFLNQ